MDRNLHAAFWSDSLSHTENRDITILGAFVNSVWPSTPISEHSRLSVPERRIINAFTNAQHPLNMACVSESVIKLLPAAKL